MNINFITQHRMDLRRFAAVFAIVLAVGVMALGSPGNSSAAADGLTWKISQHAWTSSSLSPSHSTGAPGVKDPVNGFVFPTNTAYYDSLTGAMNVTFQGSATLGNVVQGGYRIMFANPRVYVDPLGNGTVSADLSYCVSTADCLNPWVGPLPSVNLTTFDLTLAMINHTGNHVEFTATPHWATVGNQFDQELIDALPASLRSHFRASGSASDANKPPAPIVVSFDYTIPVGGDVTMAVLSNDSSTGSSLGLLAAGALVAAMIGGGLVLSRRTFSKP